MIAPLLLSKNLSFKWLNRLFTTVNAHLPPLYIPHEHRVKTERIPREHRGNTVGSHSAALLPGAKVPLSCRHLLGVNVHHTAKGFFYPLNDIDLQSVLC